MPNDKTAAYHTQVEELIRQYGWIVQKVFPTEADPDHNPFQYTIGLHDRGLPELVSIGLPGDVGQLLLNDVVEVLTQRQAAGLPLTGELTHVHWDVKFYLVDADKTQAEEVALGARRRSQGKASYLQVYWPDAENRFYWDAEASEGYRAAQPLLGTPPVLN